MSHAELREYIITLSKWMSNWFSAVALSQFRINNFYKAIIICPIQSTNSCELRIEHRSKFWSAASPMYWEILDKIQRKTSNEIGPDLASRFLLFHPAVLYRPYTCSRNISMIIFLMKFTLWYLACMMLSARITPRKDLIILQLKYLGVEIISMVTVYSLARFA